MAIIVWQSWRPEANSSHRDSGHTEEVVAHHPQRDSPRGDRPRRGRGLPVPARTPRAPAPAPAGARPDPGRVRPAPRGRRPPRGTVALHPGLPRVHRLRAHPRRRPRLCPVAIAAPRAGQGLRLGGDAHRPARGRRSARRPLPRAPATSAASPGRANRSTRASTRPSSSRAASTASRSATSSATRWSVWPSPIGASDPCRRCTRPGIPPTRRSRSAPTRSSRRSRWPRKAGLDWVYLGLAIKDSPPMTYKTRFLPHERRIGGVWRRFERE